MTQQAYRINSRLATGDKEYLIQTVSDSHRNRILSSLFSDGELLETFVDKIEKDLSREDLKRLINSAHEERRREMEQLVGLYQNSTESSDPLDLDYLGQALYYKKMYLESAKLFSQATRLDPDFHYAWNHLGRVYMRLNRFSDAVRAHKQAVDLKPHYADYRNLLGEAYLATDSCQKAIVEFNEALKINIYYGEAYLNQVLTYVLNAIRHEDYSMFAKKDEMIETALNKVSVIMPDIVDNDFHQAKAYLREGDLEKAFASFLKIREKRANIKHSEASNFYLKFLLKADQLNEKIISKRIKYLQKAVSDNPDYADLHYELAVAYTMLSRFVHGKAIEEYKKALLINPAYDKADKNLKIAKNEIMGFDMVIKNVLKD